jgi:hypothetical protein
MLPSLRPLTFGCGSRTSRPWACWVAPAGPPFFVMGGEGLGLRQGLGLQGQGSVSFWGRFSDRGPVGVRRGRGGGGGACLFAQRSGSLRSLLVDGFVWSGVPEGFLVGFRLT